MFAGLKYAAISICSEMWCAVMLEDFLYLFLLFIIYSFIGWAVETIAVFVSTKKIVNRGFLMGPYCPVYGFGALILISILSKYSNDPFNIYIMFVAYASILEYFTSYLMEKLFNARWWDYSNQKFNLNGRICVANSLAFGVLGIFLGYFVNPLVISIINVIPVTILYYVTIGIMMFFMVDLCITFSIVTKLRKNIVLLNKDMTEDIKNQIAKWIQEKRFFKAFPLLREKFDVAIARYK